jgi:hypothetical protein
MAWQENEEEDSGVSHRQNKADDAKKFRRAAAWGWRALAN